MTKLYQVSGFLFHEPSQQILLHCPRSPAEDTPDWEMFSAESDKKDPQIIFQQLIRQVLGETSDLKKIYPVYSYFHPALKKTHFIYYVQVARPKDYHSRLGGTLAWFTFKQISKIPVSPQTRHDIIITNRVIQAQARSNTL